ncbi:hypothetical protein MKZ38_002674 [Zalerion maritima]|uniref:Uncharacterized protein n=1 Tax=Zalerion maritima TaxID=339359 RepID=A0AAD5WR43_9PEZI|nr:hypothetical protein MKZ38_002674 [Zalerion maritima]
MARAAFKNSTSSGAGPMSPTAEKPAVDTHLSATPATPTSDSPAGTYTPTASAPPCGTLSIRPNFARKLSGATTKKQADTFVNDLRFAQIVQRHTKRAMVRATFYQGATAESAVNCSRVLAITAEFLRGFESLDRPVHFEIVPTTGVYAKPTDHKTAFNTRAAEVVFALRPFWTDHLTTALDNGCNKFTRRLRVKEWVERTGNIAGHAEWIAAKGNLIHRIKIDKEKNSFAHTNELAIGRVGKRARKTKNPTFKQLFC